MSPLRIAITRLTGPKYRLYADWLQLQEPAITFIELEQEANPAEAVRGCHGLLLPGGADVAPSRYNLIDEEARALCTVDETRDKVEFEALETAIQANMPVLGICRGIQLANVALGGSLIPDLPSLNIRTHRLKDQTDERSRSELAKAENTLADAEHRVKLEPGSMLASIVGQTEGTVNSSHHQSADRVASRLKVSATSPDGIIEGLEWKEPAGKPWLLLVQWHPERMSDLHSPFSRNIAEAFLRETRTV